MNFDLTKIDSFFPMQSYRPGQKEIIEAILTAFNEGKKTVFADCPTGSGKSAIAFCLGQFVDSAYILTPQKYLQDQYIADFGDHGTHVGLLEPLIDLKGRNAYPCNYYDRQLKEFGGSLEAKVKSRYLDLNYKKPGCDIGECKRQEKNRLPYCFEGENPFCPYFQRLYQAQSCRLCVMNFHSFLFQTMHGSTGGVHSFGKRELMILDEGDMSEEALLNFIEIRISDRPLQSLKIQFPELPTVVDYVQYFKQIDILQIIESKIKEAQLLMQYKEEAISRLLKYC